MKQDRSKDRKKEEKENNNLKFVLLKLQLPDKSKLPVFPRLNYASFIPDPLHPQSLRYFKSIN